MGSNRRIIILTLLLGLITAGVVYTYLLQLKQGNTTDKLVAVVVAKQDIPVATKITEEMVELRKLPAAAVHPAAQTNLQNITGKIAVKEIFAGEQVLQNRLSQGNKAPGFVGQIPAGKRAITVAVDDVTGVAGLLEPGNAVDVVATFNRETIGVDKSRQVLQNLQVLAVGSKYAGAKQDDPAKEAKSDTQTVTLAVTPSQAEVLTLGAEMGKIRLMLRPVNETKTVPTTGITPPQLMGGGK